MKFVQSLIILGAVAFFAACGGPKVVPATPVNKPVASEQSAENLHEMIILLAKYKKYQILSDNGTTETRIKYDRMSTDKNTKAVTLHSSITYDVVNTSTDYTFSYVDSTNLGYQDGNISSTYTHYINMFDSTLKKMYSDPAYLGRMRNIVAGKNPDGTEKVPAQK
ncbi:MAG: hypothetical protein WBF77_05355 [Sulfurimonadaceae bacterium]